MGVLAEAGVLERRGLRRGGPPHLAYRCGFFFDAHRSEIDCRALLEVLRRPLPVSGRPALKRLLERAAIAWLKANVYKRDSVTLEVEEQDALVRFSGRPGKRQTRAF